MGGDRTKGKASTRSWNGNIPSKTKKKRARRSLRTRSFSRRGLAKKSEKGTTKYWEKLTGEEPKFLLGGVA